MKQMHIFLLALSLLGNPPVSAAQPESAQHEEHGAESHPDEAGAAHEEHEEEGALRMSVEERRAKDVETATAERRALSEGVTAPGEVRMNAYRSSQVTPRIAAQIVARHATMSEAVKPGQPLVTLSSVEMAEAQGALIEADREWRRVRRLGRDVVSDKRYVAAQVARQRAFATVRAYGMSAEQVEALLSKGDASQATGEFDLLSPQAGRVIHDDFLIGELADPGRVLFEVSDESLLWVEAKRRPQDATRIEQGAMAQVSRDGQHWLDGKVIQLHHRLDETTRTQGVRIAVDNSNEMLHPGQYVDVRLNTGNGAPVMAVPEQAVVLMQGSPTVFKVEGDELHPQAVETGPTRGGWTEIRSGLTEGEEVVTRGTFLLKSLALKSQMGAGHAH